MVCLLSRAADEDGSPGYPHDPADVAVTQELIGRLHELIPRLARDRATVVRLYYFEGKSLTECAEALGKHKAWISRLHVRALSTLLEWLERPMVAAASGGPIRRVSHVCTIAYASA